MIRIFSYQYKDSHRYILGSTVPTVYPMDWSKNSLPDSTTFVSTSNSSESRFVITADRILLSIIPMALTFFTVLGNIFVITAVFINTRISRRITTILVVNLAVADLLVGSVVMPISVLQIFTGNIWILSRLTCKIWASIDVISCTASIVTLCIISVERFIGVTRPLKYSYLVTRRRLFFAVFFVWVYSFTVLLATVRWDDDMSHDFDWSHSCNVGSELEYVMQSVTFSFIVPLFVILIVYQKIYKVIRRRESNLITAMISGNIVPRKVTLARQQQTSNSSTKSPMNSKSDNKVTNILTPLRMHYGGTTVMEAPQKHRTFLQKQFKTAKTLGIVVGAFVLCWLPFFILYLISKFFNCYIIAIHESYSLVKIAIQS